MSPRQLLQLLRGRLGARRNARLFQDVQTYCMFIGHPRSGHTLVGSLLNAHPEVVIAHELNALRFLAKGSGRWALTRDQLYAMLLDRDRWFQRRGARWTGYGYAVPGQWQGRFRTLRVIGDKKGGGTSRQLERDPELLARLRRLTGVPLRLVLVVRNPFDNIATIQRRDPEASLAQSADRYFRLAHAIAAVLGRCAPEERIVLSHEGFIADPRGGLAHILAGLGVAADEDYLSACARLVRPAPHQSRHKVQWPEALVDRVEREAEGFDFLQGYRFGD